MANCDLGMVGLGVMGLNFALNLADKGYKIAGYDIDAKKVKEAESQGIQATDQFAQFIASLKVPRIVFLLVPAGKLVDQVIQQLKPLLMPGDMILDGGNSYYKDTDMHSMNLARAGIDFFGVGVSGGEEGARNGPSLMPGGSLKAYPSIAPFLEKAAAKAHGTPCVGYLGRGSAGHFVKMVHNGIEYGIMQLISETYDIMKRGLGLENDALSQIYNEWNHSELACYLLEITAEIFKKVDPLTGNRLIDAILDVSKQKGTGMWTTQAAMELQIPTPTIDIAVGMRHLSMQKELREKAEKLYPGPVKKLSKDILELLKDAFYVAMMGVYAQGMALLKCASEKLNYGYSLDVVASLWRGGCIIRAEMLEEIASAYQKNKNLEHLFFDPEISKKIAAKDPSLHQLIGQVCACGVPVPGIMSVQAYFDGIKSAWLPANLIQAQRDFFGSHSYERIDEKGTFHTEWKIDELK